MICRRFLAVFYPPAVYEKRSVETALGREHFFSNFRICTEEGWQKLSVFRQQAKNGEEHEDMAEGRGEDPAFRAMLAGLKKGSECGAGNYSVKEGETSPPKRYSSGSMILAMENAGQLIEDEELRSQIRGSGIGTSATRAEILKKLVSNSYLALNGKTQIITPTLLGEMIYEAVLLSMRQLLNPELTASWEKGLGYVAEGAISPEEYMQKLRAFVSRRTEQVKQSNAGYLLRDAFEKMRSYYPPPKAVAARTYRKKRRDQ